MSAPPTRPPTASELLAHSAVIQALEEAWVDSQVDNQNNRHEEGGPLVPKLCLGTPSAKLCFALAVGDGRRNGVSPKEVAKQSLATRNNRKKETIA